MPEYNNDGYHNGEYVGDSGDHANDERFSEEQALIQAQAEGAENEQNSFGSLERELAAEEPDIGSELTQDDDDDEGLYDPENPEVPEDVLDRMISSSRSVSDEDSGNAWSDQARSYGEGREEGLSF